MQVSEERCHSHSPPGTAGDAGGSGSSGLHLLASPSLQEHTDLTLQEPDRSCSLIQAKIGFSPNQDKNPIHREFPLCLYRGM